MTEQDADLIMIWLYDMGTHQSQYGLALERHFYEWGKERDRAMCPALHAHALTRIADRKTLEGVRDRLYDMRA